MLEERLAGRKAGVADGVERYEVTALPLVFHGLLESREEFHGNGHAAHADRRLGGGGE